LQFEVRGTLSEVIRIRSDKAGGGRRSERDTRRPSLLSLSMDDRGSKQRATTRFGLAHPSHRHNRLNTDLKDTRHRLLYYYSIVNGSHGFYGTDHGLFAFTITNNKMKSSTRNTDEELLRNDNVNDNVPTTNHDNNHTNNKDASSKHLPHRSKSRTDIWLERASNMPLVAALLAPLSTLLDIPALTVSLPKTNEEWDRVERA
jgi:hypothetical protein